MASEIQRRRGFIEVIPNPEEVRAERHPTVLLEAVSEIADEIDALWKAIDDPQRANAPWDYRASLRKVEETVRAMAELLKQKQQA